MSCNSAIYTANNTPASVTLSTASPSAVMPLGTTIRRFGCNIQLSGSGILLDGDGYYDVDASVTAVPAVAGDYTVTLLRDGVEVPGARQTVTAVAASSVTFNIPALVRLNCCGSTTLTLRITTTATLPAAVSINNVGVVVTKL